MGAFRISLGDPYGHEVGRERLFVMQQELVRPTSCPYPPQQMILDPPKLFFPCHRHQLPRRRLRHRRDRAIWPADLKPVEHSAWRHTKMEPGRIAGQIAAHGAHIAQEHALVREERRRGADGKGIGRAGPAQVELQAGAFRTELVLEELGRRCSNC